ncbi:MAG TPA: hypothetical protein PKD20_05170 [Candidatus Saccharibacteria bacterium]|nr:hypothetical protein [Candidatus Saccharibacteria bacterium]
MSRPYRTRLALAVDAVTPEEAMTSLGGYQYRFSDLELYALSRIKSEESFSTREYQSEHHNRETAVVEQITLLSTRILRDVND